MSYPGNSNAVLVGNIASRVLPVALKTKTVLTAARHHGLLNAMLGGFVATEKLPVEMDSKTGELTITSQRFKFVNGHKYYIPIANVYPEPDIISNGAAEAQIITPAYNGNLVARLEQVMTHFHGEITIVNSELDSVNGDAAAAEDVVNTHLALHSEGDSKKIRRMLWADTEQGEASLAGIPRIIDKTGTKRYMLDAQNEWIPQAVNQSGALNSLDKVNLLQTMITDAGGMSDVMCGGVNMFSWMRKRLEATSVVAEWSNPYRFGGTALQYGNSKLCLDSEAPSGELFIFSSNRWYMWSKKGTQVKITTNPTYLVSTGVHGQSDFWLGIGCEKRNEQGVLYGATAPTN